MFSDEQNFNNYILNYCIILFNIIIMFIYVFGCLLNIHYYLIFAILQMFSVFLRVKVQVSKNDVVQSYYFTSILTSVKEDCDPQLCCSFFSHSIQPVGSFLCKRVHASAQCRKPLIQSPCISPPSCSLSIFLGVCLTPLSRPTMLFKLTQKVQKCKFL